jgi:glycosyltransferase involved in cell wall biosynthesis
MDFARHIRGRKQKLLLVGVWVNRNWILGNWLKEVNSRNPATSKIYWVLSIFGGKHFWERFIQFPLPNYGGYFFSYPSIFESYLNRNPEKYINRSIVNYTHNTEDLGSLAHQAKVLNQSYSVHFNCSADSQALIEAGLNPNLVRIVLGAVDDDCKKLDLPRESKTVLLASKYSDRKGLHVLPDVIRALPDWKFIILGRGWENFLEENSLLSLDSVEYHFFNKKNRNILMSRASCFLSLSTLEGGPIPLIEAMSMGVVAVATNTGFAKDVILNGINGVIISNPPTIDEVVTAIRRSSTLTSEVSKLISSLTWDRIADFVVADFEGILEKYDS